MNVRYSRDGENKKMTILDENKNGFQITFIGENILSSAIEEGRILSENFNGILIDHLSNKAKDFTFQDQKVLTTTILADSIIIQKNPGNFMVLPFDKKGMGFDLDKLAEIIKEFNKNDQDGFKFSLPTKESPNKISFEIAGQDFYILVDQHTKQFSFYDSLDNKLDSSSNKIIDDEQSLISINQAQKEFEIAFDKDDVNIYSLINTLITSSDNYDFATRITMVSSDKLEVEEGYNLNLQIINKFLDSICELSGNDQVIASYVEKIKSILNDSSSNDKRDILPIFENINNYLQGNNFVLVGLFDKTQEIFSEKIQAEIQAEIQAQIQAKIHRQNQKQSQHNLTSDQMQRAFSDHFALSPLEVSSDLASSPKVEQQDNQEYASVAKSRIGGNRKERKFGVLGSRDDFDDSQFDEDFEYSDYDSVPDSDDEFNEIRAIDNSPESQFAEEKSAMERLNASISKGGFKVRGLERITTPNPNISQNQTQQAFQVEAQVVNRS